jgi:hypothetical protein
MRRTSGGNLLLYSYSQQNLLYCIPFSLTLLGCWWDYYYRAMDGFSPYFQDLMFSRLSKHLHPKHGRLYIVGLNPIPDRVDGVANILCEITRLRDACILLAGEI